MTFIQEFFAEGKTVISVILLFAVFFGFLLERLPPSAVATAGAVGFLLAGYITTDEALEVFSNPAPITIAAMFILSGALIRTGVLDAVSNFFVSQATRHGWKALFGLLACACLASGLMNNTPLVIVLIPVIIRMAETLGVASTKLLIPLSYTAILGGTLTLVGTSTNLLIDGVAQREGQAALGMLEIAPFGVVAAIAGGITLALLGPRLLPDRGAANAAIESDNVSFLTEVCIASRQKSEEGTSPEEGRMLTLDALSGLRYSKLKAVMRGNDRLKPEEGLRLKSGDRIVLEASRAEILTLEENRNYLVGHNARKSFGNRGDAEDDTLVRIEAMVAPDRAGAGRRVRDLEWPGRFGVRLLGVARHRHSPGPELAEVRLRPADRLLLEGPATAIAAVVTSNDLIAATEPIARPYRRRRAPIALACMFGVVGLAIFDVAPIATLALIAVGIVLLTRCIEADDAWSAIDGSTLVLIFAMLAIGRALENARIIENLVEWLTPFLSDASPLLLLLAIYALTSVLTELVTNNAVAIILTPLAIGLANALGMDPRPLIYAIMLGASASFATPIGYQTNTLVYSAGNYRFSDFLKIGLVMNVTVGIASCLAIWLLTDM